MNILAMNISEHHEIEVRVFQLSENITLPSDKFSSDQFHQK